MKRWNEKINKRIESKEADEFLNDIIEVCKKHGLSLSHEDVGGGFLIDDYNETDTKWVKAAAISKLCRKI